RPALPGPGRRGRPAGPPHPRADDARRAAGRTRGAAPGPVPLAPAPPRPGRRPAGRRPATHPPPTPDPDGGTMTHRPDLPRPEHLELLEGDAPGPFPHAWLVALGAWDHHPPAPLTPRLEPPGPGPAPHLPPPEPLELLEHDAPDPLPHAWLGALVAWDHDAHAHLTPRLEPSGLVLAPNGHPAVLLAVVRALAEPSPLDVTAAELAGAAEA